MSRIFNTDTLRALRLSIVDCLFIASSRDLNFRYVSYRVRQICLTWPTLTGKMLKPSLLTTLIINHPDNQENSSPIINLEQRYTGIFQTNSPLCLLSWHQAHYSAHRSGNENSRCPKSSFGIWR